MEKLEEKVIKNEARISMLVEQRNQDIADHKDIFRALSEIRVDIASIPEKLNDKMGEKYARKWVEKAMISLSIGALGNILGIIYLIIQK
jgi:hypothetical protein